MAESNMGRPRVPQSSKTGRTMLRNKGRAFAKDLIDQAKLLTRMIEDEHDIEVKLSLMRERRQTIGEVMPYIWPKLAVTAIDTDSDAVKELLKSLEEKEDDAPEG